MLELICHSEDQEVWTLKQYPEDHEGLNNDEKAFFEDRMREIENRWELVSSKA